MFRGLLAWVLAVIGSAVMAAILGQGPMSGSDLLGGVFGIGLIVGVPMLIFSLLFALPLSAIFPADFKGAAQACVAFAAMLALFWGLLGHATGRSPAIYD